MKRNKSRLNGSRRLPSFIRAAAALLVLAAATLIQLSVPMSAEGRTHAPEPSTGQQPAPAWGDSVAGDGWTFAPSTRRDARKKRRDAVSWVVLSSRYPGAFAMKGPASPRRAALTFDDVPDNIYTPQVLDILSQEHVRATFFVVGQRAAAYPGMVQRIKREGHAVGSHSYNHSSFAKLSVEQFASQIRRTNEVLLPQLGFIPRFIRPPYGEIKPEQLAWAQGQGYFVVNWNVDSEDWKGLKADRIIRNVKRTLAPGSIILQHAGGGAGEDLSGTVEALPRIIHMLRNNGYQLVTVPELLGESESSERFELY